MAGGINHALKEETDLSAQMNEHVKQQQPNEELEIEDVPVDDHDARDPDYVEELDVEEEKPKMNLHLDYQGMLSTTLCSLNNNLSSPQDSASTDAVSA